MDGKINMMCFVAVCLVYYPTTAEAKVTAEFRQLDIRGNETSKLIAEKNDDNASVMDTSTRNGHADSLNDRLYYLTEAIQKGVRGTNKKRFTRIQLLKMAENPILNNSISNKSETTLKHTSSSNESDSIYVNFKANELSGKEINVKTEDSPNKHECVLQVNPKSVAEFNEKVLYKKANIITLKLRFPDSINVTSSDGVVLPFEWRWVYRETLSYVKMPYAAFVWSLGLLYLYEKGPVTLEFVVTNNSSSCRSLTIGNPETDRIIGDALGNMIQGIAHKEMRYNTSNWCYQRKIPSPNISESILFNILHIDPILEYACCAYKLDVHKLKVDCSLRHGYDSVWFDIHQALGRLMLLYFSLLFLKVSGKIHDKIKKTSKIPDNYNILEIENKTEDRNEVFVFLEENSPVTATCIICSCLSRVLPKQQSSKSRLAIFLWSFAILLLPSIELLIWYIWLYDYAIDLAKNDISFGFSAVFVGWNSCKCKLDLIGGPFVAVGLYLLAGWILMLVPRNISDLLSLGVPEGGESLKSILWLGLERKESLAHVQIRKHKNGYTRLYKLQLCHLYLLLNPEFWALEIQIVKTRWGAFLSFLKQYTSLLARIFMILFCLPVYIFFSVAELITACFYYSIPMFSFFVIIVKGFNRGLEKYLSEKLPRIGYAVRLPLYTVVFLLQVYYLYMFTMTFLQSFNFLSRVLVYTYTALVAYPQKTYGYFMLVLTSISYGVQQFFSFGKVYRLILKTAIKLCRKEEALEKHVSTKKTLSGDDMYGISRDLFEYLVDKIRPRRVQMFHTILRLASMVFVLSLSIDIMVKFEKFEDLSFFVHVFITMFICALPSVYTSVVSAKKEKLKLTRKIWKCLQNWRTDLCLND